MENHKEITESHGQKFLKRSLFPPFLDLFFFLSLKYLPLIFPLLSSFFSFFSFKVGYSFPYVLGLLAKDKGVEVSIDR